MNDFEQDFGDSSQESVNDDDFKRIDTVCTQFSLQAYKWYDV